MILRSPLLLQSQASHRAKENQNEIARQKLRQRFKFPIAIDSFIIIPGVSRQKKGVEKWRTSKHERELSRTKLIFINRFSNIDYFPVRFGGVFFGLCEPFSSFVSPLT
jgi:hypothetical protein